MKYALKNDSISEVDDEEVDYEIDSPNKFFGPQLNLIPMQSAVHGSRLFYGSKFVNQALPLVNGEAPFVQNAIDGDADGRSFDDALGDQAGAQRAGDRRELQRRDCCRYRRSRQAVVGQGAEGGVGSRNGSLEK